MTEKENDATRNRPEGDRPLDADLIHLSLSARIRQLKSEKAWQNNDRNAITLLHHPRMRVVLIALHASAQIDRHSVDGPCTIQVIEGNINLETPAGDLQLKPLEAVALNDNLDHTVTAETEAVLLLTIAASKKDSF